jgi:hypothetical protein
LIVLRILGALFALAALAALGRELVGYAETGTWSFMPLGALWAWLHAPSLGLLEAAVVRHVSEDLWYEWIFPILEAPAWLVFGVPALVLLALSMVSRRRSRRRRFAQRS